MADRNATVRRAMNGRTRVSGEPVNEALERLRLEGVLFMRAEYTERWALSDQGGPLLAAMMHPGAERLILFHVVASGRCWVSTADGERYWASAGEVIVLPYGDVFVMGGVEPVEPVSIMSVVPPPPWTEMPIVRHGEGGSRTDIVCGCLYSEDPLFDPALKAFPPAFVVRPPPGPGQAWFDASIAYAVEESSGQRRGPRSTKLPELLLIEILRLQLANAPASERGWFAALRDPLLAPAMKAIHTAPGRKWTVADSLWKQPSLGLCSIAAFATSWGCRRFATSTNGACASPKICSPPRTSRSVRSRDASDTTPRRRSAERSNGHTGNRLACGGRAARRAQSRRKLTPCGNRAEWRTQEREPFQMACPHRGDGTSG
jgi:hypothetical protein